MDIIRELFSGLQDFNIWEFAGVFFGIASVLYARKGNILVFPTGIISVLIYVYLTFVAKLYADMAINGYYFFMSVYGWYFWAKKDENENQTAISYNSSKEWFWTMINLIISFVLLSQILIHFTDSDVPVIDATTTAIFFVGMQLMAKKKIENWIAWIIGNFLSIPLYFYKGLILTSFQFFVFFILAILGYISWKNKLKNQ